MIHLIAEKMKMLDLNWTVVAAAVATVEANLVFLLWSLGSSYP